MRSLRIAHVCRVGWPSVGGMESVVSGLAEHLASRGHAVEVLCLAPTLPDGTERHRGVVYRRLRRRGWSRYPFAEGLTAAVKGADVVHVHGVDGLLDQAIWGRRRHNAAVGLSTHGGYFHEQRFALAKQVVLQCWTRPLLGRLDGLWYTSQADMDRFQSVAPGHVIPNGLDLSRWATVVRRPEPGRWLLLGRPAPHKGHADFFAALAEMDAHKRPDVIDLVGAGTDAQWRQVRAAAERLGISGIVVHGTLSDSDLLALVGRCERAIFPSRYEGFGLGVVEMMAAGVPVVVSDIAAHRERVDEGRCGQLVPFSRARKAAEMLSRVSERTSDVMWGREMAMRFDWSRVVAAYETAYFDMLASR